MPPEQSLCRDYGDGKGDFEFINDGYFDEDDEYNFNIDLRSPILWNV